MANKYFNNIINDFDFIYLDNENYAKEIQERKNPFKFFSIDYYKNEGEFNHNEYLLLCFDKTILVSNLSHNAAINHIFSNFTDSIFYCVSDQIIQFLAENSDIEINILIKKQNSFINTEIPNFLCQFKAINRYINNKLDIVKRCIAGYLIQKSYQKANINRIDGKLEDINIPKTNITCDLKKYISLKNYNYGSCQVSLQYNIQEQKLYVIKVQNIVKNKCNLLDRERKNYEVLKHPFIPNFYEYNKEHFHHYLVIEYIDGMTLSDFDTSSLQENEIINIIFEILIVIHYIHSLGYIYRDLKPNNIIIDSNNTAILIDFDRLIQKSNDDEIFTMDFGHNYISPEIIQGLPFTNKTDIYSLGLVIKEKLVPPVISDEIRTKLNVMIKYSIKKNPNERPTISQLIRYFYLNILLNLEEKHEINNKLIKILEYNFANKDLFDPDGFCTLGMIFDDGIYIEENLELSIKYYTIASNQNDLISNIKLFCYYLSNLNYDKKLAKKYLMKNIERNDDFAQCLLGLGYLTFNFFRTNVLKSIKYLTFAADQNCVSAQFILGIIYLLFPDFIDYQKSLTFLSLAANHKIQQKESNYEFFNQHGIYILPCHDIIGLYEMINGRHIIIISNCNIANLYYKGFFGQVNISSAINYYTKIVNESFFNLHSFCQEYGINEKCLSQNNKLMINNVLKYDVNLCITQSQNQLAKIFIEGLYVPKDLLKGIYFYEKSAERDDLIALVSLGIVFSDQSLNNINIPKALKYFQRAEYIYKSTHNYNLSDYYKSFSNKLSSYFNEIITPKMSDFQKDMSNIPKNLGDFFYDGDIVERNINKAIYFYENSARYNNSEAFYKLGCIYLEGKYVFQDIKKAIRYLSISAILNDSFAQQKLGLIYYEGKIIPKNIEKAILYFTNAAKKGLCFSQFYLGIIYYLGNNYEVNIEKAIKYFKDASNHNDPYAKNNLGIIYKSGDGITKNIVLSNEYLNESIKLNNNEAARFNLAHNYFYYYTNNNDSDKRNLDESIKLLTKPSLISLELGFGLLCLIIIQKCPILTIENINKEINKHNERNSKSVAIKIFNEIISKKIDKLIFYSIYYEYLKLIELVYVDGYQTIEIKHLIKNNIKVRQNNEKINKQKKINEKFYEGLGDI